MDLSGQDVGEAVEGERGGVRQDARLFRSRFPRKTASGGGSCHAKGGKKRDFHARGVVRRAVAAPRLSLERSQRRASHYAEAYLALRVLGFEQDMAVDFYPNGYPTLSRLRVTVMKAWLPARHGLFVEGGGMTALAFLAHCRDAPCDELADAETADGQQLVMPFAGLRYTLDYRAESKRPGMAHGELGYAPYPRSVLARVELDYFIY